MSPFSCGCACCNKCWTQEIDCIKPSSKKKVLFTLEFYNISQFRRHLFQNNISNSYSLHIHKDEQFAKKYYSRIGWKNIQKNEIKKKNLFDHFYFQNGILSYLTLKSKVKVKRTFFLCATLCHIMMHIDAKYKGTGT